MIYNKMTTLKTELINQLNNLNKEELNKFLNIVDTKIDRKSKKIIENKTIENTEDKFEIKKSKLGKLLDENIENEEEVFVINVVDDLELDNNNNNNQNEDEDEDNVYYQPEIEIKSIVLPKINYRGIKSYIDNYSYDTYKNEINKIFDDRSIIEVKKNNINKMIVNINDISIINNIENYINNLINNKNIIEVADIKYELKSVKNEEVKLLENVEINNIKLIENVKGKIAKIDIIYNKPKLDNIEYVNLKLISNRYETIQSKENLYVKNYKNEKVINNNFDLFDLDEDVGGDSKYKYFETPTTKTQSQIINRRKYEKKYYCELSLRSYYDKNEFKIAISKSIKIIENYYLENYFNINKFNNENSKKYFELDFKVIAYSKKSNIIQQTLHKNYIDEGVLLSFYLHYYNPDSSQREFIDIINKVIYINNKKIIIKDDYIINVLNEMIHLLLSHNKNIFRIKSVVKDYYYLNDNYGLYDFKINDDSYNYEFINLY
jgi:hypothetical protein